MESQETLKKDPNLTGLNLLLDFRYLNRFLAYNV